MSSVISEVQNLIVRNGSIELGNPDFLGYTTTLAATTPSASRTITIPDPGTNANVLLSAGSSSQNMTSQLTLQSAVN